jgi:predicted RNA-binding Zn ribbon-like protein
VVRAPREETLTRLDDIGAAVAAGRVTPRLGHQRISEAVRRFVATAADVPVRTMTLAELERQGPAELAEVVALLYPPEFEPNDALARERFGTALARARELVASWT